jgi:hypothetical protein
MPAEQLMRRIVVRESKGDFVERNLLSCVHAQQRNLAGKQVSITIEVLFVAHPQKLSAPIPHFLDFVPTKAKSN